MAIHEFGDFELDNTLYELRRDQQTLEIGPRVFDVLAYLIEHRNRLVSKDELIQHVWGATAMSSSSVPTCIAAVRKVLGDDPAAPQYIETLRGRGYRFVAELLPPKDSSESDQKATRASASPGDFRRSIFVERDNELAALYAAFERTLSGTPQLVLVAGEPGIGKTRLLEEFALTTRDDGAVVLLGRAIEGEGAPAFWPWVQIIRTCVDISDADTLPRALGPLASSLLTMVPELSEQLPDLPPPPELDPDQARFRLFDAVAALLSRAASERPLVVLLDDLHRADTASTKLLQFATREIRDAPILFIGTYRDAELPPESSRAKTLSDLAREEPTRCIHLRGLTLDGVEEFVHHSAPQQHAAPDSLVTALYDQTGGNPFFLTQVVHLLAAEGRLDGFGSDTSWKLHLPAGIRDAVARQLDGLPPATRRALAVAAVAGREFESPVVASASDSNPATTAGHLEPALEARIVTTVPGHVSRYCFAHVLLRDCIYDALPTLDRVHLHERIAEALEQFHAGHLAPRAAELAYHYYEAIPSAGTDRAIAYSLEAARWADSRLAYEAVPEHYRRALILLGHLTPPNPLEQGKLLITLGESEIRAGEREEAQETFKAAVTIARELNEPNLLAKAALGLAPGFFAIEVGVYDPVLVSLLEEALRELPPGDSPIRAQVIARLSVALGWSESHSRRIQLSSTATAMARNVGDPKTLANALIARHGSLWNIELVTERMNLLNELGPIAHTLPNPEIQLMHKLLEITADLERGNTTSASRHIANFTSIADEYRRPDLIWYSQLFESMIALLAGRFDEVSSLAERFRETGCRARDANAIHAHATQIAICNFEAGLANEIVPIIRALVDQFPSVAGWRCALAFLLAESGHFTESRIELERLATFEFDDFQDHETDSIALNLLASTAAQLGDRRRCATLYKRLLPAREYHTVIAYAVAYFGPVSDRLGQLAAVASQWEASFSHFEHAIRACERAGSYPWLAHVQIHYAEALVARGASSDFPKIASLVSRGTETANRLTMKQLAKRIERIQQNSRSGGTSKTPKQP